MWVGSVLQGLIAVATTAAALAVMLWVGIAFIRRAIRLRRGGCIHCGYNLTGNVSGRCPECGAVTHER